MPQTLRNKYNNKMQTFPDKVAGVLLTNTAKWETTKELPKVDKIEDPKQAPSKGRKPNKK